ncbi:serine protease [Streptomyces sp. ME19-01-6]|uniref:S1 family peptidase n=1 Tax=Streptomyces sp. ME19-01-6 TaxID=3028686 RepID=UPI0029A616B3|nr:serine protease [Streptomyces sp. ME19-01-6]MDX3227478.1 serine protease [Streptomyces sp. ME19-01-6]
MNNFIGERGADERRGAGRRLATRALLATALSVGALAGAGAAQADENPPTPTPKIIGGHDATENYSFIVSLQKERNGDPDGHRCTGALIRKDWVVTAAHCVTEAGTGSAPYTVMDPALFHVRVGSNDRTTGGTVAKIKDIKVNPGWRFLEDSIGDGHDVALLQLDTALTNKPVSVAPTSTKEGTAVRQIGWGYTSTADVGDTSKLPVKLQELDTTVLNPSAEECRVDSSGDDSWGIREGDVCTDNPQDTYGPCNGDSGSPLLRKVYGRWQVVGVDSRGIGDVCGSSPDIYTGLNYHRSWLNSVIG